MAKTRSGCGAEPANGAGQAKILSERGDRLSLDRQAAPLRFPAPAEILSERGDRLSLNR